MAEYDAEKHLCQKHGVPFKRHTKEDKVWYSHKDGDGWCNEDKIEKPKTEPAPTKADTGKSQPLQRESFKADPDKSLSIENQVRAKIISDLWLGKAIDEKHTLAKKLCLWLGTLVPMSDKIMESIKAPEKPVERESVQPEDTQATASTTESQVGTLPVFKDGTDLVNYALKHGFKMVNIKETLGIKTPTDIKDVAVAVKALFSDGAK